MLEVIDVVDTAVKVGLGGLISGVATYGVTKLNHKKEQKRERFVRIQGTLLEVSEKMEIYLDAMSRVLSTLDGIHRAGELEGDISPAALKHYREFDGKLTAARTEMNFAMSRLRLAGMKAVILVTEEGLRGLEKDVRLKVVFEKKMPSHEQILVWAVQFKKVKEAFYESMHSELLNEEKAASVS